MNDQISSVFINSNLNDMNQTYPNDIYENLSYLQTINSAIWATNDYELSDDLRQVRLHLLEKQYGAPGAARHAAKTIQRAYRQYTLSRSFEKLRCEISEGRRPGGKYYKERKGVGRSQTVWSDMLAMVEEATKSTKDKIELNETYFMPHSSSADNIGFQTWQNLIGFFQKPLFDPILEEIYGCNKFVIEDESEHHKNKQNLNNKDYISEEIDLKNINLNNLENHYNLKLNNSLKNMNDNNKKIDEFQKSEIVHEVAVDLPSACFETLLENFESQNSDICDLEDFENSDSLKVLKPNLELLKNKKKLVLNNQFDFKVSKDDDAFPSAITPSESTISISDENDKFLKFLHTNTCQTLPDNQWSVHVADCEVKLRRCNPMLISNSPSSIHSSNATKSLKSDYTWSRSVYEKSIVNLTLAPQESSNDNSFFSKSYCKKDSLKHSINFESTLLDKNDPKVMNNPSNCENFVNKNEIFSSKSTNEQRRKRSYRVGLNLFNRKPEQGIKYLVEQKFLDNRPISIAKFFITRKGLSKQMIGEYIGNLQKQFNMQVLICFASLINLENLPIDEALRKFQSYFRMPGEAQKIERLMEAFAHRYCDSNPFILAHFKNQDTIFLLAFAITMLNTDLHNSSIKPERKMKLNDFIKNLRGIDEGEDISPQLLTEIYERIKNEEFKPGSDHVMHVIKVQNLIVGCKQNLVEAYRRLVCYCRLYEIKDITKKEKNDSHQREIFLFNDSLLITKVLFKKKTRMYKFKQLISLFGMAVHIFSTPYYKNGIQLSTGIDKKVLIILNARNSQDRNNFVEDLKDIILEVNEMETLRIEEELKKQQHNGGVTSLSIPTTTSVIFQHQQQGLTSAASTGTLRYSNDSGVVDVGKCQNVTSDYSLPMHRLSAPECEVISKIQIKSVLSGQKINSTPLLKSHQGRGSKKLKD